MVIDSHAHYNNTYKKPIRYLTYGEEGYTLKEGDREQRFQELLNANVPYSFETTTVNTVRFVRLPTKRICYDCD